MVDRVTLGSSDTNNHGICVGISPTNGAVYWAYSTFAGSSYDSVMRRSPSGTTGSFTASDGAASTHFENIKFNSVGNVFIGSQGGVRRSDAGVSGTFSTTGPAGAVAISPNDQSVWVFKDNGSGVVTIYRSEQSGITSSFSTSSISTSMMSMIGVSGALSVDNYVYIAGGATAAAGNPLNWRVYRAPIAYFTGTQFTISGTAGGNGVQLKRKLYDANNVLFIDTTYPFDSRFGFKSILNYDKFETHRLLLPELRMSISGANESFNPASINITLSDDSATNYTDLTLLGTYFSSSETGFVKFSYNFLTGSAFLFPSMSYGNTKLSVIISASAGKSYVFKDVSLYFKEVLSNDGVKFYKDVDNDNNKNIFSNIGFVVKVIT